MAAVASADQPAGETARDVQEKQPVPLQLPIPSPTPTSKPRPREDLTAEQATKYEWLLRQARKWAEIKSDKAKGGPITDDERLWLTRDCLLRYLRATKWNERDAEKRLLATLTWRRDYGVDDLTPEHLSPENETGKQFIVGYDKECRPCHYLNPGRQNTNPSPRQVQHLVFMVERVIDILPPGQEMLSLMINFKQSKNRSNTAPGLGVAKEVLHILQTHYPERLGKALIINVPWIVWGFFKLITPFIDPRTRDKLKFNEDMTQYVPAEQLWTEYAGGQLQFEYNHAVYWPALWQLCLERRGERKARWISGGRNIGEFEDFLSGTLPVGVSSPSIGSDPAAIRDTEAANLSDAKVTEVPGKADQPNMHPDTEDKQPAATEIEIIDEHVKATA